MKPTLSQVCTLHASLEKDFEDYAAGQCRSIELWLGKLESFLENHSPADVRALLEQHGLEAPVASYQGGLLASQGEYRREHWSHFERRLVLCQELGIQTLVVACDVQDAFDPTLLGRVQTSLVQAAQLAERHGVRLAIEFNARSTLGNNLQSLVALLEQAGHPALGICFDTFHYYAGPSKFEDLAYLSSQNLFHVQLCDLAGQPRELAADADRILPGDGDFLLEPIIEHLHGIGYEGCISIELMNPQIWQIPPRQFGEIAMTALRKLLGQASMT